MYRLCSRTLVLLLLVVCALPPTTGMAQTRTTGQIVGTVKDSTGAVVPNTVVILIDTGTGNSLEGKSGPDGGFVFPNLQPGTYTLTATAQGFQPVTVQSISVQTSRSTDLTVQFQVAGVTEAIQVEGQSPIVETTSTTIANTVSNEEIAKLPMAGRNILSFALLVPGAAQSAGSRDSEYNGLPGGAINITLDGVNSRLAAVPQRRHQLLRVRADSSPWRHRGGHGVISSASTSEGGQGGLVKKCPAPR